MRAAPIEANFLSLMFTYCRECNKFTNTNPRTSFLERTASAAWTTVAGDALFPGDVSGFFNVKGTRFRSEDSVEAVKLKNIMDTDFFRDTPIRCLTLYSRSCFFPSEDLKAGS